MSSHSSHHPQEIILAQFSLYDCAQKWPKPHLFNLKSCILLYQVAFCTVMAISLQKEARNWDYALLLSNDFKGSLKCTVQQAALNTPCLRAVCSTDVYYMHNHDDNYLTRPGFEPSFDNNLTELAVGSNRCSW